MDQKLDAKISLVETVIKTYNDSHSDSEPFAIRPETTQEEYLKVIDDKTCDLELNDLLEVYKNVSLSLICQSRSSDVPQLHEDAIKKQVDERRRAERKLRHLQDDLRYAMKKLPEPIDINLSYEEVFDSLKICNHIDYFEGGTYNRELARVQGCFRRGKSTGCICKVRQASESDFNLNCPRK